MGQEGRWTPPVGAASVQWVVGSEVRGDANASVGLPGLRTAGLVWNHK